MSKISKMIIFAWLLLLVYYFYQYALRSAPSVMIPQLSEVFGLNALGIASIIGAIYIVSKYFPANKAATLIGAAQMFGMAGGFAGQFLASGWQ